MQIFGMKLVIFWITTTSVLLLLLLLTFSSAGGPELLCYVCRTRDSRSMFGGPPGAINDSVLKESADCQRPEATATCGDILSRIYGEAAIVDVRDFDCYTAFKCDDNSKVDSRFCMSFPLKNTDTRKIDMASNMCDIFRDSTSKYHKICYCDASNECNDNIMYKGVLQKCEKSVKRERDESTEDMINVGVNEHVPPTILLIGEFTLIFSFLVKLS